MNTNFNLKKVNDYMNTYFKMKDNFNRLTDNNKSLVAMTENSIALLPKSSIMEQWITQKINEYFEMTKTIGDEKGTTMALVLKNKNQPSLIEEDVPNYYPKAGYINIAILIYGIINIGIILAIAFMK